VENGVEWRNDRCNDHAPYLLRIDLLERKQIPKKNAILIDGPFLLRGQPPMHDELVVGIINSEDGVCVSQVNGQKHVLFPTDDIAAVNLFNIAAVFVRSLKRQAG
jgi:hypothetical protein